MQKENRLSDNPDAIEAAAEIVSDYGKRIHFGYKERRSPEEISKQILLAAEKATEKQAIDFAKR